ncbi:MAG: hypothetical protein K8I02_07585, partial [Candidatus Methylomirabilis sp.]|nr:hypothetical protein [Deltaproteobacteria bacterium]
TEERFAADGPLGPRCELRYEGVRKEGAEPQVAVVTFLRRGTRVVRLVGKGIEARSDDFRRLYDHMALSLRFPTGAAPLQPSLSR